MTCPRKTVSEDCSEPSGVYCSDGRSHLSHCKLCLCCMEPQLAASRNCSVFRTQQHASFYKCQDDHLLAPLLLEQLHWLPVRQRIDYKLAVLTYKTRSTSTPLYLSRHIRARVNLLLLVVSAHPLHRYCTSRSPEPTSPIGLSVAQHHCLELSSHWHYKRSFTDCV